MEKSLSDFHANNDTGDRHKGHCKSCAALYAKDYKAEREPAQIPSQKQCGYYFGAESDRTEIVTKHVHGVRACSLSASTAAGKGVTWTTLPGYTPESSCHWRPQKQPPPVTRQMGGCSL